MSRSLGDDWPTWLRDVDALLAVHPHFVLSGNVRDRYLLPGAQVVDALPVALHSLLARSGFDTLLVHDLVDGYRVMGQHGDQDAGWAHVHAVIGADLRAAQGADLGALANVLRRLAQGGDRRLALVLDYASRLTIDPGSLTAREHEFFAACLKLSHMAQPAFVEGSDRPDLFNPVFWLVEREHDLPAWFTAGNRAVRSIPVAWPDLHEREVVSRALMGEGHEPAAVSEVAGRTEGLELDSLFGIAALLDDQQIAASDADDAVRTYTVGAGESPWRHGAVAERLRLLDADDASNPLSSRVLGQQRAVTKAVDILKRAVLGLSGAQAGRLSAKPRGVLFFAGPTGTGKTELAKALTSLVFGNEQAYVRFDMSEFSAEHAGDRLVGAPPGYVGFEGGGELTDAIRRRPYSLLLFDEVEKAHPRILDKFLQLLDDGRLTDGRGTTVHFSETLIVFTSNLGMSVPAPDGSGRRVPQVDASAPYEELETKVRAEIRRFFTEDLNRPELLNRVGDNIIVFDFIRSDTAARIVDLQVRNITARVLDAAGVHVEVSPEALADLRSIATADLSFGGRGIGNVLESRFVNPLARALFERNVSEGDRVVVQGLREAEVPEVVLRSMVPSDAFVRLNRIHYPVSTLGPGTWIGVWFQGCSIGCGGCVSRDTWDREGAPLIAIDDVVDRIDRMVGDALRPVDGVTISGGEPFDQPLSLASLLLAIRRWLDDRGSETVDLLAYTGYELDEAARRCPEALDVLDGLIVGPYQSGRPSGVAWWGSANQQMVPLTGRGRDRYDTDPATGAVQIDVDADGRVWIIGIPAPRLLARVEARLISAGIRLTEVSWRP